MRLLPILSLSMLMLMTACSEESATDATGQTGLESSLSAMAVNNSEGASLTRQKCGSCHALDRNIRKIGPSLKGIYGKAPSITDVPFEAWDEVALDKWLKSPRSVKKSTRMGIPGISDAAERKAIIEYLKLI